jgi:hypothetical protein
MSYLLLENLIAPPQIILTTLEKNVNQDVNSEVSNNNPQQLYEWLIETLDYIDNRIVIPIINTDIDTMEYVFQKQIFPFTSRLLDLNRIITKKLTDEENYLSDFIKFEFTIFNEIMDIITTTSQISNEIRDKLLSNIINLRNYDIVMIDLLTNNKIELSNIVNDIINIDKLRANVLGSVLAFNCIGYYIKNNIHDNTKLLKLIELFETNTKCLTLFIELFETIIEDKTSSSIPIDNGIGIMKSSGFHLDLNKMEINKEYLVNYKTSHYLIKKTEKSDLSISEFI